MTRQELLEQFDDICDTIKKDDELILKILAEMFNGARGLWDVVHTHVTSIYEDRDLDDEVLEAEVNNVICSFRKIMDNMVERELLDENNN